MKNIYILFITFSLISCSKKSKKELILGDWKLVSITELKTMKTKTPNGKDDRFDVSFNKDSIFIANKNEKPENYGWSMTGDTLNLTSSESPVALIFLRNLNEKSLEVEVHALFLDSIKMVFERYEKQLTRK